MNERIKQLAEQADPDHWHKRWYSGINPRVMDPEIKKFVELIVQECVQACINEGKTYDMKSAGEYASNLYATAIKEHFGVEQ